MDTETSQEVKPSDKSLYPTHSCFSDAMELIDYTAKREPEVLPRWRLIHAICEMPDGTHYSHGWVEDYNLNVAIFAGILEGEKIYMLARIAEYREHLKVIEDTKYTMREVITHNITTGHHGPWEKKYQDLSGRNSHLVCDGRPLACKPLGSLPQQEEEEE